MLSTKLCPFSDFYEKEEAIELGCCFWLSDICSLLAYLIERQQAIIWTVSLTEKMNAKFGLDHVRSRFEVCPFRPLLPLFILYSCRSA